MSTKSRLKYEVVRVELSNSSWSAECPVLTKAANDMSAKGWTLVSIAVANDKCAILAFSRPQKADPTSVS